MKKKTLTLISVLALLSASFTIIGLNSSNNFVEVNGYTTTAIPTTINLNDATESTIRSYYSDLNALSNTEKQGTNLLKNLKPILKNEQKYVSYDSGSAVWNLYEIADRDWDLSPASAIAGYNSSTNTITNYVYGTSGDNPYLHSLYVNRDVTNQTRAWGDHTQTNWGINREHVWPKSQGFEDTGSGGARGDPMHLLSGNGYANNIHSNYFYGFVNPSQIATDCGQSYSFLSNNMSGLSNTTGSNTVFEPQDSDKGDIARAVFYMVARYNYYSGSDSDGIDCNNPNLELVQSSEYAATGYQSSTSLTGKMGILSDLLAWNHLDPVDEYEIHRNNLLFNNYTNNRNPFIDFPEWADYIWGTANLDGSGYSSQVTGYANPTTDTISAFSPETPITPTQITLNSTSESLGVDQTFQASVVSSVPTDATKTVNWSVTSGTGIVSVSSEGLITAIQSGNAVVTATSTLDSEVAANINITVTSSIAVTGVTLNKSSTSLEISMNETLTETITPTDATNKNVTWSSSDNSTVSVDSDGLITGLKAGTATITVTTEDGSFIDTCLVTVIASSYTQIVISEAYGGGGNSGSTYKQDFVELYNNTNSNIDLSDYRLFYASAAGTFNTSTVLSGTILAKSYFLVQEAAGTGGTVNIPTSDVTGSIAMSGTAFKLALTNSSTTPTSATDTNVVDFVGAGSTASLYEGTTKAPAPSNTNSIARTISGGIAIDTDENGSDFTTGSPTPMDGAFSVADRIMAYASGEISTPECSAKYTTIKSQITTLTAGSLSYFQSGTETNIANARARYLAWANANSDANPYENTQGLLLTSFYNGDSFVFLSLFFVGGSVALIAYCLVKRKKEYTK